MENSFSFPKGAVAIYRGIFWKRLKGQQFSQMSGFFFKNVGPIILLTSNEDLNFEILWFCNKTKAKRHAKFLNLFTKNNCCHNITINCLSTYKKDIFFSIAHHLIFYNYNTNPKNVHLLVMIVIPNILINLFFSSF